MNKKILNLAKYARNLFFRINLRDSWCRNELFRESFRKLLNFIKLIGFYPQTIVRWGSEKSRN